MSAARRLLLRVDAGTVITLAGVAALREQGASRITATVSTCVAADFTAAPDVTDLGQPG